MSFCGRTDVSDSSDRINWLRGLFFCSLQRPLMRPSFTGSTGVKGGPPLPACAPDTPQPTHRPFIPPFSSAPASYHRSFLSSHTHPLSHRRLIDEATFDNGIRNWGVCLVIRYYQSCLITAEEDPRQTDGFLGAQIWPQIMKLRDGVL